jgi:SMP-30/Gluconolactonase/LRE-like region
VRTRWLSVGCVVAALGAPVAWAAGGSHRRLNVHPCARWTVRTLVSGQGWLENLAFDGRGSMTLSALSQGKLLRLGTRGRLSTLLAPVSFPGGQRQRGRFLYFNTGDSLSLLPAGTIDRLDLRTGARTTWTTGLTRPNGLALLPNGDAVLSGAVPATTGLTRIRARDPRHPRFGWARLSYTNGLVVDPSGRWLYVDRDLPDSTNGEVDRVLIADPRRIERVGALGTGTEPDDMDIDPHGVLYITGFDDGKIYRLDPRTHVSCAIAGGLAHPTAVKFGGPGWHARHLYATAAMGEVYELIPPEPR